MTEPAPAPWWKNPGEIWWCTAHDSGLEPAPPDTPEDFVCWTFHHEPEFRCRLVPMRLVNPGALVVERDADGNWPEWALASLVDPPLFELSPAAMRDLGMDGEAVKVNPRYILDALAEVRREAST